LEKPGFLDKVCRKGFFRF